LASQDSALPNLVVQKLITSGRLSIDAQSETKMEGEESLIGGDGMGEQLAGMQDHADEALLKVVNSGCLKRITSIRGIGPKRAQQIISKFLCP
jgi:DNA uptake protein ComE-like DNA-binding protein